MHSPRWCSSVGALLLCGTALAATLDDFKEAVGKEGCDSIPYSDLRNTCKSKSSDVNDWCKNSSKRWSCDDLDPTGLAKQIENVKRKVEELKREKADLVSRKSGANDDSERRELEDKIAAKEKEIRELEDKIVLWEQKLADEKTAVHDRIYIGEKCLGYREEVARAFLDAKSSANRESDPQIKPYAEKLVEKYEAGERGHVEAIDITKRGIDKCKAMR
jgi:hypothetical protein